MADLFNILLALSAAGWAQAPPADVTPADVPPVAATEKPLAGMVQAVLRTDQTVIPVGSEVFVEFAVQNMTDEPVKLVVPGALEGRARPEWGMGLPLEHVFSATDFKGLEIASEESPSMGDRITRKPDFPVAPVTLAPFATVGLRFDVARFYPGLHQAGVFQLRWRPYGGALEAAPITLTVVQYKQVVMDTEYGALTMQLLYDKAPRHVANFLDLIERRFYNNKSFHTVYHNQFILGGCPNGDGTGKRSDGATIPAEFNDTPFEAGTVGMALIAGDPNSGSSQFFICLSRQPAWDGRYTAFAQITGPQSLATLRKLGEVPTDDNRRPLKPLIIKSITAADVGAPLRSGS
jgi:cyclophilin family peptidyl-prolyl cis-trans isomerase